MSKFKLAKLSYVHENGYLLVFVMAVSLALMTISVAIMSLSSAKYAKTNSDGDSANAVYVAEAGVSDTIARLNANNAFTGYSTKKVFYSNGAQGKAEYTTAVTQNSNDTITVTSTGHLSQTPTSATPFITRSIKVTLIKTKAPVIENVLAGSAGLTMSGNYFPWFGQPTAMQKGSIYSRGKIRLNGTGTSIGTATDSARVLAANLGCGTTANFPQQCASNDPPITLGGGGIFSSGMGSIYGSVCATDQTSSSNIFPGPTGTGLQSGCIAPDYGMPYFDKKAFTDTKVVPMLPAVASCPLFGVGAPVWLDNTRIIGSVTLSGNFFTPCVATLMGDVYIKGDLTISSYARLNVSNTLGSRKPVIVVNGKVNLEGDAIGIFANSSNSPVTIISFSSTNTACSNSDDNNCTLTSAELYDSSVAPSSSFWWMGNSNRAITIGNTSYGGAQNGDFSGAAVYSYYGSTLYQKSGNGSLRGIGGQEVVINPGGAFSFSGGSLSITDTSPFSSILFRSKYVIGDYQQSF